MNLNPKQNYCRFDFFTKHYSFIPFLIPFKTIHRDIEYPTQKCPICLRKRTPVANGKENIFSKGLYRLNTKIESLPLRGILFLLPIFAVKRLL